MKKLLDRGKCSY